jgi:hypothetical protein
MTSPDAVVVQSWFGPARVLAGEDPVQHRPERKFRGRRRYYRKIMREAARSEVHESDWYDRMHWHVDWFGVGNLSWRDRRSHLAALFATFRDVLGKTAAWTAPHQCWLQINAVDSSADAVYLHTPNPNPHSFPIDFDWVDWDVEVPERLREFMTDPVWQFGRVDGTWTHFFVRVRPHSEDSSST